MRPLQELRSVPIRSMQVRSRNRLLLPRPVECSRNIQSHIGILEEDLVVRDEVSTSQSQRDREVRGKVFSSELKHVLWCDIKTDDVGMLSLVEFRNVVDFACYRYPYIRFSLMIRELFRIPGVIELRT